MRGSWRILTTALLAGLSVMSAGSAAHAAKFKVLHSFCGPGQHRGCSDGSNLQSALIADAAGNLYGTAATGGTANSIGTVFELERKPNGGFNFKTIFRFCSFCGGQPSGALILDTHGNLYGTASDLVFELSQQTGKKVWSEKILYQFCSLRNCSDGSLPVDGLTYAGASSGMPYDGSSPLYGATNIGGANNEGTAFQLTNNSGAWTESVLYNFCSLGGDNCSDGGHPTGGLILDEMGNLYGTTIFGGNNLVNQGLGAGVVYKLSLSAGFWEETVLHTFCSSTQCQDGAYPSGALRWDAAGNLLGTTGGGGRRCSLNGEAGCGVVFRLSNNGESSQETVLYTFCKKRNCLDGAQPVSTPVLNSAGVLVGTTENGGGNNIDLFGRGGGVLYSLSDQYAVLHHFCSSPNCADGEYPEAGPIIDQDGFAVGTASLGGEFGEGEAGGTVFKSSRWQLRASVAREETCSSTLGLSPTKPKEMPRLPPFPPHAFQ